jgi:predicted ATPase
VGSGRSQGWAGDGRAVRLVRHDPAQSVDTTKWPATVPAVEHLLCEGLEFPAGLTVLVGENGSGKSTIVEMLARAYGAEPFGRLRAGRVVPDRRPPATWGGAVPDRRARPGRPRWSYFLRADTTHSLYTYLEDHPGPRRPERFHQLSHGEGFLELLRTRVNQPGFYLMDEPDAPLSFTASLGLAALLHDLAREGSQAIVATHSPLIAAVPGAAILELGDWGIRSSRWEDLYIVGAWRRFLTEPDSYFRHLFAE